jgi:hypothetical protein
MKSLTRRKEGLDSLNSLFFNRDSLTQDRQRVLNTLNTHFFNRARVSSISRTPPTYAGHLGFGPMVGQQVAAFGARTDQLPACLEISCKMTREGKPGAGRCDARRLKSSQSWFASGVSR